MTRIISFRTALLVLAAATGLTAQGRAYRIAGDELVVDRRSLWQNWIYPEETLELSPSGEVRPLALRKDIDAVPEIVRFLRLHPPPHLKNKEPEEITLADAVQAGSNPRDAVNVLDGDPTTYWQPDLTETPPVELGARWWLMVDLGRNVIAKRLVLRFAEEELGDPFLQCDVLVSNGERSPSAAASKHPFFATVYRTLRPNKDVRVLDLTFEDVYTDSIVGEAPLAAILPPSTVDRNHRLQSPRELEGASLRYVMVVVRDSDFGRGRLVSPEAYAALPEDDKGAVVHHKLQRDGRLTELSEADYPRLPAEQQGEILHYRKERPRLADIEVWTEGDNIMPAIYKRGGEISGNAPLNYGRLVDGLVGSFTEVNMGNEGYILFDLGTTFWLDSYRLMYGGVTNRERRSFNSYDIEASDGSLNPDGTLKFKTVARRTQSQMRKDFEVHDFDLVKTRFFRLVFELGFRDETPHTGAPGEIYLYGRGYIAEVRMESGLVELGGRRNLLSMSWEADTPPGTAISIQTRAGNELREVLHYYKADGTEISEKAYNNPSLMPSLKGPIVAEMVEGDDWSGWSQPYEDASGSPFLSPSPREFLNIAAALVSDDPDLHPTLRSIRLRFSNPVAQGLLAEVTPTRVDSLGVPRDFSLFLRPEFDNRDPGFDELLLRTPPDMSLEFAGLYAGSAEEFDGGGGTLVEDVEVMPTGPDSLRLSFPIVKPSGIEVLRLDFRTALFTTGAQLQAAVKRTRDGEDAWQRVDPGDALASVDSEAITLIGEATGGGLLAGVDLSSPVITPNGDGINDEALFSLNVVRVADGSPVDLQIHDLGGRLVRRITVHGSAGTGLYEIAWDGLDANGLVVPPGIYLARLRVDTDDGGRRLEGREAVRTLAVSY